jgi:predicted O-linked N-acetylglucosamine transferase (SPINDLY family)
MSDDTLSERIRSDEIDILVDLAGHTAKNRLSVFARKPAPVSLSWLGFGYTTGLTALDYYLTDETSAPLGCERLFSELPYRLAPTASVFRPSLGMGPVGFLPAEKCGFVTFGSMTRAVRINYRTIRVWSEILKRVEGSRLVINSHDFLSVSMQDYIVGKFADQDISRERLSIGFESPPWDVLRTLDIGLDCFPHNSGATLFESLYMGVPIVTLAGRPSVGRLGSSILVGAGHSEWIAHTEDEYVEIAVALAADLPKLSDVRSKLRLEMQASPLMDEVGFARRVEEAYRVMWAKWCKHGQPKEKMKSLPDSLTEKEFNEVAELFNTGRYEELETRSSLLVVQYPESGFAWKALGTALLAQGKASIPAMQKAVKYLPDDAEAYNNLGLALQSVDQIDEAAICFRSSLHIKPDYADANFNLGVLAIKVRQLEIGVQHFKAALEANPNQVRYWLSFIDSLIQAGQTDVARHVLNLGRERGLQGEALEVLAGRLNDQI